MVVGYRVGIPARSFQQWWEAPVFTERTSVGLDVHARSVAAAAIDSVTGDVHQARLTPSYEHIRSWIADLPGPVAVAYEAGPTGFGLYRALSDAGVRCAVAAPSKLQKSAGDRVKTDARDAMHLAKLLRLDEVTAVSVPSVEQEAARDLVRAREDCRGDFDAGSAPVVETAVAPWHRLLRRCGMDRGTRSVASARSRTTVDRTSHRDGLRC